MYDPRMQGVSSLIGLILPNAAGLVLAAAITALGCVVVGAVTAVARGDSVEWESALGGALIAAVLGAVGLILVALGAPAFK
jgi:hypothetical protein